MAVITFTPQAEASEANLSINEEEDFRSYSITYLAICNSTNDTALTVRDCPQAPRVNSYFSYNGKSDPAATLKEKRVRQIGPTEFEVEVEWDTSPKSQNLAAKRKAPEQIKNPLAAPPQRDWRTIAVDEYPTHDLNGRAICNSAGCPFSDGLPVTKYHHSLRVERNEGYFDWHSMKQYVGAVNGLPFAGFPAGQVLCSNIEAHEIYEETLGFFYCRVIYEMMARDDNINWQAHVLDMGPFYKQMVDNWPVKRYTKTDSITKSEVSGTFYLNGIDGQLLSTSREDSQDYAYRHFTVRRQLDFNRLGLLTQARRR